MTRKEEIKEMATTTAIHITSDKDMQVAFADVLRRGAEWADHTMIEKACEWIEKNYHATPSGGYYYLPEDCIEQFKQAMKGEYATEEETKEFFDILHECGCDFKDGSPIKNGENAEPECRNADKELFFNALSDLCNAWKGTIPDADFYEVLFKFDTEVAIPEMKKAFGWNSEIIK